MNSTEIYIFDRDLGYIHVQRKLNILNIKKTYIRHRYCTRKRRRRGARQEEDLVREDSGSRGEKVNEKVIYIYNSIASISQRGQKIPCVKSLGLRSRIYEDVVEEMSIIRMLMLFANARRETEDDENGSKEKERNYLNGIESYIYI